MIFVLFMSLPLSIPPTGPLGHLPLSLFSYHDEKLSKNSLPIIGVAHTWHSIFCGNILAQLSKVSVRWMNYVFQSAYSDGSFRALPSPCFMKPH